MSDVTQQELDLISANIKARMECAACGGTRWSGAGNISPLVYAETTDLSIVRLGEKVLPMIALACENCFHLMLFARNPLMERERNAAAVRK